MLRLLREEPDGLHSHDARAQWSIGDPAKRVCELREAGYEISATLERRHSRHGVRYRLLGGGDNAEGGVTHRTPASEGGEGSNPQALATSLALFEPDEPESPRPLGPYDPAAA